MRPGPSTPSEPSSAHPESGYLRSKEVKGDSVKQILILSLCFVGSAILADDRKTEITKIRVVEQGIYKCEVVRWVKDPRVVGGERALIGPAKIVQETNRIPAVVGTRFGFRFQIDGEPKGQSVELEIVGIYPGEGLKDSAQGKPRKSDRYTYPYKIGKVEYMDYSFDHDWELVTGE